MHNHPAVDYDLHLWHTHEEVWMDGRPHQGPLRGAYPVPGGPAPLPDGDRVPVPVRPRRTALRRRRFAYGVAVAVCVLVLIVVGVFR